MTNQEPVSLKKKAKKAQEKAVASEAASPLVALLEGSGFRVQAENESTLSFPFEGGTYYLSVPAEGEDYYHVIFPNFWELADEEAFVKALVACDAVNREVKVVKLHTLDDDVWAGVEAFHESPEVFVRGLPRVLGFIQEAVRAFRDVMLAEVDEA